MPSPVPTRFSDEELALIDELVAVGAGESRSAVIRRGVHHLADSIRRPNAGRAIADAYRDQPANERGRRDGKGDRHGDDRGRAVLGQAEIWLVETPNQKRRPVLVVSRDEAIPVVNNVVVAPLTRTIRSIPTCIPLGPAEGVDRERVAAFDNLTVVPKSVLTRRLGGLGADGRQQICQALEALANC